MSKNGIAWLPTKEERQVAKLQLAETKRQSTGTAGYRENRYLDLDLLPTKYSGNDVVNNPNVGGLQPHRPWKTTPNILTGLWRSVYVGYWDGDPTWFDNSPVAMDTEGAVQDFSLAPYAGNTNCSFQWIGYFRAPHTANYTFYMYTDDEAMLWIGNAAITAYTSDNADLYTSAPSGELSTDPLSFEAGDYIPIRIQYGNNLGQGYFSFSWSDDQDIKTTDLVLWLQTWDGWPLNGYTWTNKLDADFPGLYNGTTLNPPTRSDMGGAPIMQFGGNGQYWDVVNPTTGNFTVGVWFNTTSILGSGTHFFDNPQLVGSDTAGPANDWGFCISNGRIGFGGVSGQTAFTTEQFNDGNWHYAVATRVKTTGAMTVFVDGVQLAQITEAPGVELTATDTIRIGGDPTNTAFYEGYMAEVQFYQVVLTPSEIASNFAIQRGIYGV